MINENINEDIQTIINELFFEKLDISKTDSFYVNNLALIIDDHKIWIRIINTMFQHEAQKTFTYERYKWIMSLEALFHLKMNMIELLLINHYDFTKLKKSINRSHLRTHAEFWNRKKTKLNNWDFHIAQKLMIQSYKARVMTISEFFKDRRLTKISTNRQMSLNV
jgi:alpha-amylase/alpha-mannosidase (GH57 family)